MQCCVTGRRPQPGAVVAQDTAATLYAGHVSAERKGAEGPVLVAAVDDLEQEDR